MNADGSTAKAVDDMLRERAKPLPAADAAAHKAIPTVTVFNRLLPTPGAQPGGAPEVPLPPG